VLPLTLERPVPRVRPRELFWWAAIAAAFVALLVPLLQVLGDTSRDRVSFTNPTPWEIDVTLLVGPAHSRMPLATVGPQRTVSVEEIAVPDGDWVFELSAWGQDGRVTLSHRQLQAAANRVGVPAALVRALEAAAPPHSPFGT
jgi:hypothetical protein